MQLNARCCPVPVPKSTATAVLRSGVAMRRSTIRATKRLHSATGALPVCMRRACYKYTVWCSGAKELYDLSVDPYEVDNRWANGMCNTSTASFI